MRHRQAGLHAQSCSRSRSEGEPEHWHGLQAPGVSDASSPGPHFEDH